MMEEDTTIAMIMGQREAVVDLETCTTNPSAAECSKCRETWCSMIGLR
jgi:hypothetical protein